MVFFFSLDFIVYFGHFWVELIHVDIFFFILDIVVPWYSVEYFCGIFLVIWYFVLSSI